MATIPTEERLTASINFKEQKDMNGEGKITYFFPECTGYTEGIPYAKFPVVHVRERLEVSGEL